MSHTALSKSAHDLSHLSANMLKQNSSENITTSPTPAYLSFTALHSQRPATHLLLGHSRSCFHTHITRYTNSFSFTSKQPTTRCSPHTVTSGTTITQDSLPSPRFDCPIPAPLAAHPLSWVRECRQHQPTHLPRQKLLVHVPHLSVSHP